MINTKFEMFAASRGYNLQKKDLLSTQYLDPKTQILLEGYGGGYYDKVNQESPLEDRISDEFLAWYKSPAGNSGLDIGDTLDGDGSDALFGFRTGYMAAIKANSDVEKDAERHGIT